MANLLGILIIPNTTTSKETKLTFARVLIEVDITKTLPSSMSLIDEYDKLVEQPLTFELKPEKCMNYNMFGNMKSNCKGGG